MAEIDQNHYVVGDRSRSPTKICSQTLNAAHCAAVWGDQGTSWGRSFATGAALTGLKIIAKIDAIANKVLANLTLFLIGMNRCYVYFSMREERKNGEYQIIKVADLLKDRDKLSAFESEMKQCSEDMQKIAPYSTQIIKTMSSMLDEGKDAAEMSAYAQRRLTEIVPEENSIMRKKMIEAYSKSCQIFCERRKTAATVD